MYRRSARSSFVFVVSFLMVAALATPAPAAVGCDSSGLPTLTVDAGAFGAMRVNAGVIEFKPSGGSFAACGSATVANTDTVNVTGSETFAVTIGGWDDVNITVTLGGGGSDRLTINGTSGNDSITIGAGGVMNFDATLNADPEITSVSGVTLFLVNGDIGNDTLDARGGAGTGSAMASSIEMLGSGGTDTLKGGTAADTLNGGGDLTDLVAGFEGSDNLSGGLLDYSASTAVSVDLGTSTFSGGHAVGDIPGSNVRGVNGSEFGDTLTGNSSTNTLKGNGGVDTINGAGGSDTIEGGAAGDNLDGGTGSDTVTYASAAAGVQVDLVGCTAAGSEATGDTLAAVATVCSFEHVTGTAHEDEISGDSRANTLRGGASNDEIFGDGGADVIFGQTGADTLDGGAGGEGNTLNYSGSSAAVTVDLEADTASGGEAQGDLLTPGTFDNVTGSSFGDTLTGNALANTLTGGAGGDIITGADGDDAIEPGSGSDVLDGGEGGETDGDELRYFDSFEAVQVDLTSAGPFTGGTAGGDTAPANSFEGVFGSLDGDVLTGGTDDEFFVGLGGDDTIDAGGGDDYLQGDEGDDLLVGGPGADDLRGGEDDEILGDTVSYSTAAAGVTVDLGAATASGSDAAGDRFCETTSADCTVNEFEILVGSAFADALAGDDDAERIEAGSGNDTLAGGDGADELLGEGGADVFVEGEAANGPDVLDGGPDADTADYSLREELVTITLDTTDNDGGEGEGDNVIAENAKGGFTLDFTGDGENNVVDGGDWDDVLRGGGGNDVLRGRTGRDRLYGQTGDDELSGGAGDDYLHGGSESDTVSYSGSPAAVTINLGARTATGGDATGDAIAASGGASSIESVIGSSFNDTLIGDARANTLSGGAGNDTLVQGASPDGADVLLGGSGIDRVSYSSRTSRTVVRLDSLANDGVDTNGDGVADEGDRVATDVENITTGSGNDRVYGSSASNVISVGSGNDLAYGGSGNDSITGGPGADSLRGDTGNDKLYAKDGTKDSVNGGSGTDGATWDGIDVRTSIEYAL